MARAVAFGVGSFHFAWRTVEGATTAQDYVAALTRALNDIPTIKNVEIAHEEIDPDCGFEPDVPDWGEGEGAYPWIDFFQLKFEVFIPKRLQDELLDRKFLHGPALPRARSDGLESCPPHLVHPPPRFQMRIQGLRRPPRFKVLHQFRGTDHDPNENNPRHAHDCHGGNGRGQYDY